jgi:hypothetical protein
MFLFVDLETVFKAEFTDMSIVYHNIQLHMPNSSGSLIVTMKQSWYKFHAAATLWYNTL